MGRMWSSYPVPLPYPREGDSLRAHEDKTESMWEQQRNLKAYPNPTPSIISSSCPTAEALCLPFFPISSVQAESRLQWMHGGVSLVRQEAWDHG